MDDPLSLIGSEDSLSEAMRALTEKQQKFVMALLDSGDNNHTKAAIQAGYAPGPNARSTGHWLAHNPKVILAINEEARKRMSASAIMVVSEAVKIAKGNSKDKMKALEFVANRIGMHPMTEAKMVVEHRVSDKELRKQALALCEELGIDPSKLLGGPTIESTLEIPDAVLVTDQEDDDGREGLEDLI